MSCGQYNGVLGIGKEWAGVPAYWKKRACLEHGEAGDLSVKAAAGQNFGHVGGWQREDGQRDQDFHRPCDFW